MFTIQVGTGAVVNLDGEILRNHSQLPIVMCIIQWSWNRLAERRKIPGIDIFEAQFISTGRYFYCGGL